MREILFRGQTRKKGQKVWMDGTPVDGQWVYGGVLQGIEDFSIIYGGKNVDNPGEGLDKWCVYTDTLGQFTGLTDKNGKKIFEGDIVQYKDERGEIVYSDSEAMFCVSFNDWYTDFDHLCGKDVEVIGIIHDTPETLEVSEDG